MYDPATHEDRGQGWTLRCPVIGWDVACEGCTCHEPCPAALDVLIVVESYRRTVNGTHNGPLEV